jgi:hypothetical protein
MSQPQRSPSPLASEVTFWQTLSGKIVAQKHILFFEIPDCEDMGKTRESRELIARHFDSAPCKQSGMDITGAQIIDIVRL